MAIGTRSYARRFLGSGGMPTGIRWLLIANVTVFVVYFFATTGMREILDSFGLRPSDVVTRFFVWQLFTYMFLHAGVGHILWNMLALWFFGRDLENIWGTDRFLKYYFFCGVGAGICVVILNYLFGNPYVLTIGASGAIYGLLLAAAVLWPDQEVLFSFLIPIKMKYFVMIIGALAFFSSFGSNTGVSNIAHLGGMLFGYIYLKMPGGILASSSRRSRGPGMVGSLKQSYETWKIQRAKKKFQVYLKKQGDDPDRWVN